MSTLVFLVGIIIGSFLNVCICRIPKEGSLVFPGSHCPKCSTPLQWFDLIPIISFILGGGKCRYCGKSISSQYLLVELITGFIFTILYYYFGFNIDFIFYSFIFSILIIIAFIDIDHQIIPNRLVLIILLGTLLYKYIHYLLYSRSLYLINSIMGLIISSLFFLIIVILSKGGMGGGDVKLIGALGFILGIPKIILNIFLSFLIGGVVSVLLLAFNIKGRKDPIPFGPFIVLGFIITFFAGDRIINWYILNCFLR